MNAGIFWLSLSIISLLLIVATFAYSRHTGRRLSLTHSILLLLIAAVWGAQLTIPRFWWFAGYPIALFSLGLFKASVLNFLSGPLIFLYARVRLTARKRLYWFDLLHFLPLVSVLLLLQVLQDLPFFQLLQLYQSRLPGSMGPLQQNLLLIYTWAPWHLLSLCGYAAMTIYLVYRYHQTSKDQLSPGLIMLFALHLLLAGLVQLAVSWQWLPLSYVVEGYELSSLVTLIVGLLYTQQLTLRLKDKTASSPALASEPRASSESSSRYQSSSLDEDSMSAIVNDAEQTLQAQKLHLNSEFRLADLAKQTGFSTHQLSEAINRHTGKGFNDWVNHFRIEHAKRLLADQKFNHLSMIDIAAECGYNSKSTFYTAFKKQEDCTPRVYRQNQQSVTEIKQ